MMKKIDMLFCLMVVLAFLLCPFSAMAGNPLPDELLIDGVRYLDVKSTSQDGTFTNELIRIPDGATVAEYAAIQPALSIHEPEPASKGLFRVVMTDFGPSLAYELTFGEFSEMFNWSPPDYYQTAQNGGEVELPPEPGLMQRSWQFAKDNPIPVGIGAFLVLDMLEGDGVDAFGLIGGGDSDGGTKSGDSNSGTEGSIVVQNSQNTTINVTSPNNNDSTAAPNYPPNI